MAKPPLAPDRSVSRNALVVIAVIVAGAALYWLRGILTPLALAIFLMIMIDGFVRVLRSRFPALPSWAALTVALFLALLTLGLAAVVVVENARSFADDMGVYQLRLQALTKRVQETAAVLGPQAQSSIMGSFSRIGPVLLGLLGNFALRLQDFLTGAAFVLIYLGFLIASRGGFERKVVKLFPERTERQEALYVFNRIRNGVQRYLWIQTVTGLIIAGGSWAVMAAVGLNNASFWAFMIFIVGYIPIVGGVFGVTAPSLFALLQFPTLWQAAILLLALNAINFVVGNVLLPRMQGKSLNMDPVVVLLALAFWGVLWGVPGMFLSTPLAVMAMVILAQFEGTRWIAILLSGDGDPMGQARPAPAMSGAESAPAATAGPARKSRRPKAD